MPEPSTNKSVLRWAWKLFLEPAAPFSPRTVVLFVLSLVVCGYYASEGLRQAFAGPYIVQDDARQHVFWMARFVDSRLFPNDLAANYFQAMAPSGYSALYRAGAWVHIDPLVLNKCLPIALGLIATSFCFALCVHLIPVPGAAFISSVLLNQSVWMQDDLISATPRAFVYPLLLAFLFYLARKSWIPCLIALALQGLFYPSVVFISAGALVLSVFDWQGVRPRLSEDRRDYAACVAGLAVSAAFLLIYASKSSGFGPVVTASEARLMPEFAANGRMRVFHDSFWEYWISGQNTGLAPLSSLLPITICGGFLLPLLLWRRQWFPLAAKISSRVRVLVHLAIASAVMFLVAHLLMFRLYLPNRYSQHSLRIILCVAAGPALIVILNGAVRLASKQSAGWSVLRESMATGAAAILALALILYPGPPRRFMQTSYRPGRDPRLYQFFSQQPENVVIASLSREADRIPIFSRRSNLISWEYSLPFHKGYYGQMRQRAVDLINAQYSPDSSELKRFVRKYGVDFIIVDRRAFRADYLRSDKWLRLYQPAADDAAERLEQGAVPALKKLVQECPALETEDHLVIAADCILNAPGD